MKKLFEEQYWNSNSQYRKSAKLAIEGWVNEVNNDGFTPLHYASYKGNLEMIRLLENLRASIVLETKAGLNVLHLAAQGDRMASMIHFYDRFDLNCLDSKKGTPLHWACYMGSENVTTFLLAQHNIQIDVFDEQEQTPLHLATIYGNTRIVRRLLIKGADRTLRNGKGEKPIEIAIANEFNNIARMLSEDFSCIDHWKFYYNLKT
jgi:ankyrin repeat protein